jgi:hypothetical protein
MTCQCHYYSRKGGCKGKKIRLGEVEPNGCSFRKVPMFGLQQNKQTAELEREPNCSIVSQLAVTQSSTISIQPVGVDLPVWKASTYTWRGYLGSVLQLN